MWMDLILIDASIMERSCFGKTLWLMHSSPFIDQDPASNFVPRHNLSSGCLCLSLNYSTSVLSDLNPLVAKYRSVCPVVLESAVPGLDRMEHPAVDLSCHWEVNPEMLWSCSTCK